MSRDNLETTGDESESDALNKDGYERSLQIDRTMRDSFDSYRRRSTFGGKHRQAVHYIGGN